MSPGEVKESRDSRSPSAGLKILFCGTALMLFGVAVAMRPEFQSSDANSSSSVHINSVIARIPIVAGAVIALLGGTRMSMGIRPLARTLLGAGFFIGAVAAPILVTRLDPGVADQTWTTSTLMPFFVFRILGLIFASTGLLKVFPGDNTKR
jgi:hypothetical protein